MMKALHTALSCGLYAACWMAAVTQSFAQPEYWETIPSPFGMGDGDLITGMAVDGDGTIYGVSQFQYVVRSNDLGMTWEKISLGARGFKVEVGQAGTLYIPSEIGVFKSTDKGTQWELVSTTPDAPHFVQDVQIHSSGAVFAGVPGVGVIRSTDQGGTWEQMFAADIQDIAEGPNGDLFATSLDSNCVYRSLDDGVSWSPVGLSNIYSTAVHVTESGSVLLATMAQGGSGRVYRSENEGDSWNSTTLLDIVQAFASLPNEAVYAAAANSGVWRSTDDGKSWASFNTGLTDYRVLTVLYHPDGYLFTTNYFGQMFRRPAPKSSHVAGDRKPLEGSLALSPNPAVDRITLSFRSIGSGRHRVTATDVEGRRVRTLLNEELIEGEHIIDFELSDTPNGAYHLRIESPEGIATIPFVVAR